MENNSAESGDSSPRSRDIDSENPSWEEQQQQQSNYKVKFMCSYGGKIQPRPHDHQLTYVGGDTKILAVDRNIKFADLISKLQSFCDVDFVFKYQLPGEDLDALVSVTNDEDLEHMMAEYDRVHRISPKPPRLRLFLFLPRTASGKSYVSSDSSAKPNQQWLVDSVNSVPVQSPNHPDLLFGLGNSVNANVAPPTDIPIPKFPVEVPAEDRNGGGVATVEIQRQINELQKLQIVNQEQAMFRKNSDEALSRAFNGDHVSPTPLPTSNSPTYWQEINGGGGGGGGYTTFTGNEHQMYMIPPQAMYHTSTVQPVTGVPPPGLYQTQAPMQPVTSQMGQNYYPMQRVQVQQPDVYREQPVFSVGPPPPQPKIITRPPAETGYAQVAYDASGRQLYYTAAPGGVMTSPYPTAVGNAGVDLRQVAPLNVSQEGIVATTTAAV